jgi:hypothetical protein
MAKHGPVNRAPTFYNDGTNHVLRVDQSLVPGTTDGAALGTSALNWSDLFLDSGAVINFDSADVTITHSANLLTFDGGGIVFNQAGGDFDFREKSDDITNMFVVDGGLTSGLGHVSIGRAVTEGRFVLVGWPAHTAAANTTWSMMAIVPSGVVTIPSGTTDFVSTLYLEEPNITATGTVTTTAILRIASVATEGTNNYAILVDAGSVRLDGSLWVESTPTEGSSGEQLTSGGAGAVMTWAAASSLGKFKNTLGALVPVDALKKMISWEPKMFRYWPDAKLSTHDYDTVYAGVYGEDAPEVMHHDGKIFSPVSAFGYTVGAIQAMQQEIVDLREQVKELVAHR